MSREIFDINNYYDYFDIELKNLFEKIKKNYTDTTNLFLKFSFDKLKNHFLISNVLFHMFNCSRSDSAKQIVAFAVVYILMNYFDHQILISKLILIFFQSSLKIIFIKIDILKSTLIYL